MLLASFDIFDTTLVRLCGEPWVVFSLTALRLWPEDAMRREEYVNLRRQAEREAGVNACLEEIYKAGGMDNFPEYSAAELMEAEMSVEAEMLTVNPAIKKRIEELRVQGWTIKFLSDMYLPSAFLANVLRREGCLTHGEEVIVSCEWGARKDNGSLYRKVRERYRPVEWTHFGDNRRSDFRMARKSGVKATLVQTPFTSIERRIAREEGLMRDGWRSTFLAGMMRAHRLRRENEAKAAIGADFVAPLYVAFVIWLLRNARSAGLERLHFLSRDGYIMMRIAEALAFDGIELNYLFVSRKALMRAYLQTDGAERFVEVTDRQTLKMQWVDRLLANLQIDRKKLNDDYGITFDFDKILTPAQQEKFLDAIFAHPKFTKEWLDYCEADARLTQRYLSQEGLTDGTRQAMVDIGWLGTTRLMVNSILERNIPTYYLGVRGDVYGRQCGDYASFFPNGQLDTAATALIENYFSASPWPSTVGYTEAADHTVGPRFADGQEFEMNHIVEANIDACRAIALELKPYIEYFDDDLLYRWAKLTIDCLAATDGSTDLTPLTENADFDGIAMARRLTVAELLSLSLTGARPTAFNRGSLALTVPKRFIPSFWKLHLRSARLRENLYRAIIKLKNR